MTATPRYELGQELWIYDVNARGREPKRGTVTKIGRKLVTVKGDYTEDQYRIEGGYRNDNYGHQWLVTDDEKALSERRTAALQILHGAHVELGLGCLLDVETIEQIAAVVSDAA